MFDKKDKDDVCYCEICTHKTARECIELQCSCCWKADEIRLNHVVVSEDDLSPEEKARRAANEREGEESEREAENYAKLADVPAGIF